MVEVILFSNNPLYFNMYIKSVVDNKQYIHAFTLKQAGSVTNLIEIRLK